MSDDEEEREAEEGLRKRRVSEEMDQNGEKVTIQREARSLVQRNQ